MITLYKVTPVDVERSVRNTAMVGKNPRAKEASLRWLLQVRERIYATSLGGLTGFGPRIDNSA